MILLVATDGAAGLTSEAYSNSLDAVRHAELMQSASVLGVNEVITWAHPDSGLHAENSSGFAHTDADVLAEDLAVIIRKMNVDVVIGYDTSGGYGHPDHVHVHRIVRLAHKKVLDHCTLFEATLPREPIATAVDVAARLRLTPSGFDPREFQRAWTPRNDITHRVDVRNYIDEKKHSIQAHASQAHADGTVRTLGVLTRLPRPLFAALMGTEYYVKVSKHT